MKNKGITLVALVITIIILLILAGVTLSITIGDNGIFKIAKQAGEETNKQAAIEKMSLKITNIQMVSYANKQEMPTLQEVADNLCEDNEIAYVNLEKQKTAAINDKIIVGENTAIYTKLEEYPYEFEINSKLELVSLDGVKISDITGTTNTENKGEIPEGYIKPSGTKEITVNGEYDVTEYEKANVNVPTYEKDSTLPITTKSDKIDVSNYQYADTTGLYTKDQVQSGEDVYWHKTTVTFPTDGSKTMTIDLGYIPSFIYITATGKDGTRLMWYSDDGCKSFYWHNFNNDIFRTSGSAWGMVDGKLKFTVGDTSGWSGVNIKIFAIK